MLLQSTRLFAFFTAAALSAAPSLPKLDAIKIDGDLAAWGTRGLHLPFLTPETTRLPDAAHSNVSALFAWDDLGLLVVVEVTDTTPNEARIASAAYTADSVELFLAPDPAKPGCIQLVLSPGKDPAYPAPRSYVFNNSGIESQAPANEPKWAVQPRANGYVAEVRLPWAALKLTPAAGLTIGTRLYVNDKDGEGGRTRFVWQPEASVGRFHALTLSADAAAGGALDAPVAWTALDVAESAARLNMIGGASLAGSSWQVREGEGVLGELGELKLVASVAGGAASGSFLLPARRTAGSGPVSITLTGPNNATLTVSDKSAGEAAGAIARASGGRGGAGLGFARAEFPQHVFEGSRFPELNFIDPARVARFLGGAAPTIVTRWMDADGRDVTAPDAPGLYAARSEITIPGRPQPTTLNHLFYRMPAGTAPWGTDEMAAQIYGFGLQGADATPSQSARVAERWWYKIRRARGWAEALPYKIHVPAGDSSKPRPLIVHLHGSGQHSELAVNERLPLLIKQAGPEPIIVYPQSPGGWRGPAVGEMIDDLSKKYSIDPARVYLIGFSLGGMGSWEVAFDQPERFAAVVPIGGRMGSPPDAARLKDMPVWVFNGADDPTTTSEDAETMVEALRRAGGKPRFTILPGKAHGDSQDAAYLYPGLFEWMLAQRRGTASQEIAEVETDPRLHSNGNGWKLNQATVVDKARARVLLMGDSILAGYQKFVIENVKDKAYIDTWVQPYHQGHMQGPLPKMMEEVLAKGPYDVVVFNMGLHGWPKGRIPEGQFVPLTKKLVTTLRQHAPQARLVWLSSTPVTEQDARPDFHKLGPPRTSYALDSEINPTIMEHNRMAAEVMNEENVPVLDLYSLLKPQLNLAVGDKFHWTEPASKLMAAEITQVIADNLPKTTAAVSGSKP